MVISIGRHALLSSILCLNPNPDGLGEPGSLPNPLRPLNFVPNTTTSPFPPHFSLSPLPWSSSSFSNDGEDTNKSFKLRLLNSLSSPFFFSAKFPTKLCGFDISRQVDDFRLLFLVRSIRKVVLGRRKQTKGLVLGLLVGLWVTPHCVANSLNFCKAAIVLYFFFPFQVPSLVKSLFLLLLLCVSDEQYKWSEREDLEFEK